MRAMMRIYPAYKTLPFCFAIKNLKHSCQTIEKIGGN